MANFGLSPQDYEQLSRAVKIGNVLRFDELYLTHFKKIRNYTARRGSVFFARQVDDATNMAFAIFLNELRKEGIPTYGNLESYVVTIAANEYARQRSFKVSPITENLANEKTDDLIFDNVDLADLMEVFENLCSFCKECLKLRYWDKHSMEDLVALKGFPNARTAISKLASIKKRLRAAFLNQQTTPICQTLCRTGEN